MRLSGVWAGPEGSLLLWVTMVAWAGVAARMAMARSTPRGGPPPAATATGGPIPAGTVIGDAAGDEAAGWAIRLGAVLTGGYGLVLAVVASPFERLAVPAVDGLGLQPVLEHPAMVWHPPILYAGLTGLLVASVAAAALSLGRAGVDRELGRRALAVPLALLTVGLATGAIWANVELGWGGYWAWDPIESAGLVAWLLGMAAFHGRSARAPALSPRVRRVALILPGVAAVWATTVTRVGVVASVHAFADRPGLRLGLFLVAGGVTAGAALLSVRAPALVPSPGAEPMAGTGRVGATVASDPPSPGAEPAPADQRRWAVAGLAAAGLIVAVGTYEPLVEAATSGDRVAIAGHYYTRLLWPVVMLGAALAIRFDRRWLPALMGAVIGLVVTPWGAGPFALAVAAAGGAVAASAASLLGGGPRRALAHLGVGLVLVGVAGTVATEVSTVDLAVDTPTMVDGRELIHRSITITESAGTRQAVATLEVDGTVFEPRLVSFPLRGASTAEMARRLHGLDDLQVILIDGDATSARYRINHLPRVGLVWLGCAVIAAGLLAQPLRRLRASSSDTVEAGAGPSPEPGSEAGGDGGEAGEAGAAGDVGAAGVPDGVGASGVGTVGGDDPGSDGSPGGAEA
jgi:cytochrome c biogenesis factor